LPYFPTYLRGEEDEHEKRECGKGEDQRSPRGLREEERDTRWVGIDAI
jgi:hypothetical protein